MGINSSHNKVLPCEKITIVSVFLFKISHQCSLIRMLEILTLAPGQAGGPGYLYWSDHLEVATHVASNSGSLMTQRAMA